MNEQARKTESTRQVTGIRNLKAARWAVDMARRSRKLVINIVGIGLIVLATIWFADWVRPSLTSGQLFTPPVIGPQAVKVKFVSQKTLVRTVTYSGTVHPYERVVVRARTSGFVKSMNVYPGDPVKPGDLLVRLETSELLPRLEHALANHEYLKAELKRDQKLFQGKAISASALELSRQKARVAAARLALLRTQIGYAKVTALSDGWVSARKVDPGEFVRKGQELIAYERLRRVRLRFDVAVQDLVNIKPGTEAMLELRGISYNQIKSLALPKTAAGGAGETIMKAKVTSVFPRADARTRLGIVEVAIDNPGMILKSNAYVVARFVTGRAEKAWVVPNSALTQMLNGKTVIFIGPAFADQGEARMQEVVVGLRNGTEAQIVKGLTEPSYVVISGNRNLTAGERVTVIERQGSP